MRATKAYRREEFGAGLARHGFEISDRHKREPDPGDVLVLWNRIRSMDPIANRYQLAGARVIIAENGYLPMGNRKSFALALDHHNGAGRWAIGDGARFPIECRPWRESGRHLLVLAQRGIGEIGVAQPHTWVRRTMERIASITQRPVRFRRHPGPRNVALDPDLRDCHAALTWASGAGIKAIVAGVPVFHGLPAWIGAPAALPIGRLADRIERPFVGDRRQMLDRLSWAQWAEDEITSGEAFAGLLELPAGRG